VSALEHEEIIVRTGQRSGLPVIVAIHSTRLGQAVGGCRIWRYGHWRDGLDDALRLAASMSRKCAMARLANGGGKTVVAVPDGAALDHARRTDALRDVGDVIASLDGRYATGPDVGTTPTDMVTIGQRTEHVFCQPPEYGGSGDSSPHTATGVVAALRAVCARRFGSPDLGKRRLAITGLGSVGGHLARQLTQAGASLVVSDIDPGKQDLAKELGADWEEPGQVLTADADVLIPAALGGVLTRDLAPRLRCGAVAGPANNQLAEPAVADLLQSRGITWVPDYVASAGGVIHALSVELHNETPQDATSRVRGIERTVGEILDAADSNGTTPAEAARVLAAERLKR
jgi:leucine dehydrogenase